MTKSIKKLTAAFLLGTMISITPLPNNMIFGNQPSIEYILIEAKGIMLPIGKLFKSEDLLTLGSGTSVTLISENGSAIEISGPFTGKVSSKIPSITNSNSLKKLARIFNMGKKDTTSLGAVRSVNNPLMEMTEPYSIPIDRKGVLCSKNGNIILKLPNVSEETELKITTGTKIAKVFIKPGTNLVQLDPSIIIDGKMVDITYGPLSSRMTFVSVPAELQGVREAAFLAEKACNEQALVLINQQK